MPDKQPTSLLTEDRRWEKLYAAKLEVETVEAFKYFRSFGIEPLLIKGWAAARNYPKEKVRSYFDIDLSVSAADFEAANNLRKSEKGSRLSIDLHRELRHLDTRPWAEILSDSKLISLAGYDVRIPSAEDHLRILATHWLNDGGERKDKLWDIYYAVENRPPDFQWHKCLDCVSENRRAWLITTVLLAHKYLGLQIDDLPFAGEAGRLPKWLTDTVEREWSSGVRLRPLPVTMNNRREFFRQLRKRIPPNPIQATVEYDGNLLNGPRFWYQLASMGRRVTPSLKGLFIKLFRSGK